MTDIRPQIVVDTETGGLDPATSPLLEVAWCHVGSYRVHTIAIPHDSRTVEAEAAHINGYYARHLGDPQTWATEASIKTFLASLAGATIVGANPAFDVAFLTRLARDYDVPVGWSYRLLDVESMAYALLPFENVPGLMEIVTYLNAEGRAIPLPDHTAYSDVRTTCAVLAALEAKRLAKV